MNQTAELGEENLEVEEIAIDELELDAEPANENNAEGEQADNSEEANAESETDEVIVSIGEESPPTEENHAPEWVRELRKSHRDLQRKNRELEAKLHSTTVETKPIVVGKKPTLEDHDYDAEKFEEALASWFDLKRQADEAVAQARREEETQANAWQAKLDNYGKAKAELRVKDYEDAEATAQELFTVTQQGVMLQGAENPALVIYALGKNPKKAKELADIKDPVKFAFAVAKLETQLKVTNRRAAPPPESIVQGTGRSSGAIDSTLERLREEAARTGNMTKVIQYKQQKRSATK